ncbi:MAG TPA: zinc ribbon domain-containing protein [Pyrinomonadaceae bacterium]|nr:zinc ribbon domain-containing protein [Pyrinomonadaceae bacterium]
MFCPTCGSEERQARQFCRACGTDLRAVKVSIERPDSITSAVSAREEIGRAVAQKIREVEQTEDLKRVAHEILPEIEKFLESPEEKRFRRVRAGIIIGMSGLGAGTLGLIMSAVVTGPDLEAALWVGGLGLTAFTLGLGFVLNGLLFTKPRKGLEDRSPDARLQNLLDAEYHPPKSISEGHAPTTSNLTQSAGSSVTEHTTNLLKRD